MAACGLPDPALGIALRLSAYLDCQARSIGESGFQAVAGGLVATSLLSGLVTVFIALIGYRMVLGHVPDLRDGVSWTVRLGVVLALVTSWPAFQTLFYRVAVDGPGEAAALVLPKSGLPSQDLALRVQLAYDTIRLGLADVPVAQAGPPGSSGVTAPVTTQTSQFQTPLPNTASMLVISTIGLAGSLRLGIGFLLSVAPLAILGLLFEGTRGLFNGWLRALAALILAVLGVTIATAIDIILVESELASLQQFRLLGTTATVDPQALTTIVMLFGLVMLVVVCVSFRMAGAFGVPRFSRSIRGRFEASGGRGDAVAAERESHRSERSEVVLDEQRRVTLVAEMLTRASRRDDVLAAAGMAGAQVGSVGRDLGREHGAPVARAHARRTALSRSRSSVRRDRLA